MNNQLVMLPVRELHPHPDNPRKQLGDIEDLTQSIRINGVLQNLTVVPRDKGGYTIVIGHRRCAAARQAKLIEVPCVISDMDYKEQLRTMLMENIQRTDLNVQEQAQGFQMMMDLGASVKELSRDTGFSQKTINQRLKIAALNKKAVEHAVERGAQISDFIKLEKIEDPLVKDELTEKYLGTNDFNMKLQTALEKQKVKKTLAKYEKIIKEWATKVDRETANKLTWIRGYYGRDNDVPKKPAGAEDHQYFYTVPESIDTWSCITLYMEGKDKKEIIDEEREKRESFRALLEEDRKIADDFIKRRRTLVLQFLSEKTELELCDQMRNIYSLCLPLIMKAYMTDAARVSEALGAGPDKPGFIDSDEFADICGKCPLKVMMLTAMAYVPIVYQAYIEYTWQTGVPGSVIKHRPDPRSDKYFDILASLGYSISTEELQFRNGTHPVFVPKTME